MGAVVLPRRPAAVDGALAVMLAVAVAVAVADSVSVSVTEGGASFPQAGGFPPPEGRVLCEGKVGGGDAEGGLARVTCWSPTSFWSWSSSQSWWW